MKYIIRLKVNDRANFDDVLHATYLRHRVAERLKISLGIVRDVERFLGNSCYHFVTRTTQRTGYQ
jgi:hypothetical protein